LFALWTVDTSAAPIVGTLTLTPARSTLHTALAVDCHMGFAVEIALTLIQWTAVACRYEWGPLICIDKHRLNQNPPFGSILPKVAKNIIESKISPIDAIRAIFDPLDV